MIGTVLGIIAGYKGGVIDEVINFFTNMVLVIPNLPLLLVLAAFIGQASPLVIAIILGFTSWAWGVRVTRVADAVDPADAISSNRPRCWASPAGASWPSRSSPTSSRSSASTSSAASSSPSSPRRRSNSSASAIPNTVSWGIMLYNAQNASALSVGAWWDLLSPCFALALLGLGLALINFAIDEIANPRLRTGGMLEPLDRAGAHRGGQAVSDARPLGPQPHDRLCRRRDRLPRRQECQLRHRAAASSSALPANPAAARAPSPLPSAACTSPPALIRTGSQILLDGRDVLDLDDEALRKFRWREVAMVFQSAMNSLNPGADASRRSSTTCCKTHTGHEPRSRRASAPPSC